MRCRIAPLQQRSRIVCLYTRVNNCSRIERGVGTNLSNAELEVLIRAMTGEVYTPELLVLLDKTKALCEDQGLRTVVLATLLMLDDGGLAVRLLGGDPNCGVQIPDAPSQVPAGPVTVRRHPPAMGRRQRRAAHRAAGIATAIGRGGCDTLGV